MQGALASRPTQGGMQAAVSLCLRSCGAATSLTLC